MALSLLDAGGIRAPRLGHPLAAGTSGPTVPGECVRPRAAAPAAAGVGRPRRHGLGPGAALSLPGRYAGEVPRWCPGATISSGKTARTRVAPASDAVANVTFGGICETCELVLYGRLTLEAASATGRLVTEGEPGLVAAFERWLRGHESLEGRRGGEAVQPRQHIRYLSAEINRLYSALVLPQEELARNQPKGVFNLLFI